MLRVNSLNSRNYPLTTEFVNPLPNVRRIYIHLPKSVCLRHVRNFFYVSCLFSKGDITVLQNFHINVSTLKSIFVIVLIFLQLNSLYCLHAVSSIHNWLHSYVFYNLKTFFIISPKVFDSPFLIININSLVVAVIHKIASFIISFWYLRSSVEQDLRRLKSILYLFRDDTVLTDILNIY